MKMILNLLIALIIAGILFLLTGYLSKGNEAKSVVTVATPIDEAWRIYNDPSTKNQWVKGYQSKELTSGTQDMPGSSYVIKLRTKGKISELTETLVSYVKEQNHSYDYVSDMMDGHAETHFESVEGDSTKITSSNRYRGKTVIVRALMQLFNDKIQVTSDEQLSALKSVIESNAQVNNLVIGRLDTSGDGIFGRTITSSNDSLIARATSTMSGTIAFENCIDQIGDVTHVHFLSEESSTSLDRDALRVIMQALRAYKYQPNANSSKEECGRVVFTLPISEPTSASTEEETEEKN